MRSRADGKQSIDTVTLPGYWSEERALWLCVFYEGIKDAMIELLEPQGFLNLDGESAVHWLMNGDDDDCVGSAGWIAYNLAISDKLVHYRAAALRRDVDEIKFIIKKAKSFKLSLMGSYV